MSRYTWDGVRTFMKIETAAQYALDHDANPFDLCILEGGHKALAADWEVEDLLAHMRDQAAPL